MRLVICARGPSAWLEVSTVHLFCLTTPWHPYSVPRLSPRQLREQTGSPKSEDLPLDKRAGLFCVCTSALNQRVSLTSAQKSSIEQQDGVHTGLGT